MLHCDCCNRDKCMRSRKRQCYKPACFVENLESYYFICELAILVGSALGKVCD